MKDESMTELTVKVPQRWADFFKEYYEVTGYERQGNVTGTMDRIINIYLQDLDPELQVYFVKKYSLSDVCKLPHKVRQYASGKVVAETPIPAAPLGEKLVSFAQEGVIDRWVLDAATREIGVELPGQFPPPIAW
jgi:hypothetical protein